MMLKWVTNWSEVQSYRASLSTNGSVLWAVKMPKTYPECRVTRRGIANIAVTDDETLVAELRDDGGEAKVLP
jgi:hypothetical protein